MPGSSASRVASFRARRQAEGLRPVVLWLPDTGNPAYRARIAEQCRRLGKLTPEQAAMAEAFEREAAQIPGWR